MNSNGGIYIHLGSGKTVRERDIIGVFDMDTATSAKITKDFLKKAQKKGVLESVNEEIPKSFVLVREKSVPRVYIALISPKAVVGRIDKGL